MATYVNDLRLKEIATGDESGTWGTSTNTNLELIAEAFSFGTEAITTNADTHTTTIADGSTDPGRSIYLKYTGTLDSACTITIGPNTVSKLWFIENGTSGSQNIIISQGSGANVTIPPGDTKAIYSDGAGSGAAMVDAFASLNVVDLKVEDDLTVTDDLIVNGDIDLEGSIDVNGTANLDVVDIDGAVDMASTLAVGGAVTANAGVVIDNITIDGTEIDLSSGDLTLDSAGDIILDADGADILLKDAGTTFGELTNSSTDFVIKSTTSDKDIIFKGNDGGSAITALTLDMSNAGKATFLNGFVSTGTSHSIGSGLGTSDASIEIGPNRSDSGNAFIDLIGDTTYTDYGARFIRANGGANTTTSILHRGTGNLSIKTQDAAALTLVTNDTVKEHSSISSGGRFLVGHTSALTAANGQIPYFQVIGTTASTAGASLNRFSADNASATLFFVKSRNATPGSNTIVQDSDTIGSIDFKMDDGTNYQTQVARIMAKMDGTPGENDAPGRLTFHTTADGAATVTERLRITSAGKVGINTQSPTGLLEISGGNGAGTLSIVSTVNSVDSGNKIAFFAANRSDTDEEMAFIKPLLTSNSGGSGNVQTGSLTFGTAGSARLRIKDAGRLMLGTTTVASANAAADDFVIKGSGTAVGMTIAQDNDAGTGTIFFGDTSSSSAAGFRYNHNTGDMAISAEDNVTFNCDRVGIGETSPSAALHVKSNGGIARLESTSATGNNYLSFYDSSALKGHVGYTGSSDDDFNIFQNESANLKFFTAGSEAARFDSSQNFLVGNTSTQLKPMA